MLPASKKVPLKNLNVQLQLQISKTTGQWLCVPERLSSWPPACQEKLKEHSSLHWSFLGDNQWKKIETLYSSVNNY